MAADVILAQARADFNSVTPANTNTTATWGGSLGIPDTYGRTVSLTGCGYWNYYQTTSSTEPLQNLARLSWQQNSVWLAGTHGFAGTGDNNMPVIAGTQIWSDASSCAPLANELYWHPDNNDAHEAVARWTAGSHEAGTINISGTFRHGAPSSNNTGVKFWIYVNGVQQYELQVLSTDAGTHTFALTGLAIAAGQNVDFVLNSNGAYYGDASLFSASIVLPTIVIPTEAVNIALTSGNYQTGGLGTALASPFVVKVTDASGTPVPGVGVTFAVTTTPPGAMGQSLSTTNATTNGNGQASSILTLGNLIGTYTVTAASGGLTGSPVTFTANASNSVALTYDAAPAEAGAQDGAGTGWDGSTANWWNGSSDVVWPDTTAYEAIIGAGSDPAGTIAVTGTRTLNKLTFNAPGSGTYTLSGGTLNFGGTTPTITGTVDATISSILAGTAGLTKVGAGNLTLSALNTFSGDFTISQGTVIANAGSDVLNRSTGPLGNPQANGCKIVVATGTTLAFTAHDSLGNAPSLPQVLLEINGGTVTTDGHLVTLGPVSLNNSFLTATTGFTTSYGYQLNGTVSVTGASTLSASGGRGFYLSNVGTRVTTFDVAAASTLGVSGPLINGWSNSPSGLTKAGNGTMILTGSNTYGGTTTITGGTLQIGDHGSSGSLGSGRVSNYSSLVISRSDPVTIANSISGSGSFSHAGDAMLTLAGINTYTGDTLVNHGTLTLATGARLTFLPVANGISNRVTGSGTVTFDGTFSILTAAADVTSGNSWNLIDIDLTKLFGANFAVAGFSRQPDGLTWIMTSGDQTWTFSEITGNLTLVSTLTPFQQWMSQYTTIPAGQTGLNDDPDGDGASNQFEFAFGGNPEQAAVKGLWTQYIQNAGDTATRALTLIVATLRGVSFSATADGSQTGPVPASGFSYIIEGSLDLAFPNSRVSHLGVSDTVPGETGLPDLTGTGWEYHTFRLDASIGLPDKGFLRASINSSTVTLESLLAEMTDYDSVASWPAPAYSTGQASSYDRASTDPTVPTDANWFANHDYENFLRGDVKGNETEWVMMEAVGPGCVTRFWYAGSDTLAQRPGNLRIYLDGNPVPVIDERMLDLLNGTGSVPPPFANELSRGHNMFLPIPYAHGCRIVYVGTAAETSNPTLFWYNIEYRTYQPGTMLRSFVAGEPAAKAALLTTVGNKLMAPPARGAAQNLTLTQIIPAGHEITLDLPAGAAAVTGMRINVTAANRDQALRSTVLRGSFDGIETIWCPIGDFAGSGVGLNALSSWYRSITPADGWMTNRWTMPYASTGQFKIDNLGSQAVTVTLEAGISAWHWDERSMHFHSNWHSQHLIPTWPRQDFNFLTVAGQGVYLGDTLGVFNTPGNGGDWWGEGDEKVWVDNDSFPSHFGTGTEDYYCYAWGDTAIFQSPFANQVRVNSDHLGNTCLTRTRNLDRIPFRSGIQYNLEIWHWISNNTVDYAATTYWYAKPAASHNRLPQEAEAVVPLKR